MWKDEIVEKVRKNREKIFSYYNYDMLEYSKHILEAQKKELYRLISKDSLSK